MYYVEYLYYFLHYSRQLNPKELEQLEENEKAIKKKYPTLEQVFLTVGIKQYFFQLRCD